MTEQSIPRIVGDESYRLEVAGERNYLANFERIFGKRDADGVDEEIEALLVLEPTNPYDPNAVRVEVDGLTLGYLSRHSAPAFRSMLRSRFGNADRAIASGIVRGGWYRGSDDQGDFGVTLDVPLDALPAITAPVQTKASINSKPAGKPWHRKWWVWLIVLVFFLGLCAMFSNLGPA
jgi:hypothetical protein